MATQLTGKWGVDIRLHQTTDAEGATPVVDVTENAAWTIATGVIADAADMVFLDDNMVITATTSVDFSGSMAGYFGTDVFVKLKGLYIYVIAGPGTLTIARPAGATGVPIFSAISDALPGFAAGDWIAMSHRALAGWAVTAATGDIIELTAVGGNVTVRLIAIGTSA